LGFELRDLVAQEETASFQALERQLVVGRLRTRHVDQLIKVGVSHSELDQVTLWGMQGFIHGRSR